MMNDQPFAYYPQPPSYDSYSGLQYTQSSYDAEIPGNDASPFADPNYAGAQTQSDAPAWSAPFATPDTNGVSFQRRGAVSGAVPGQSTPEASSDAAPRGLRIDTNCTDGGGQLRAQEVCNLPCLLAPLVPGVSHLSTVAMLERPNSIIILCKGWMNSTGVGSDVSRRL